MHLDNHPISCHQLGRFFHLDGKQLQQQYKQHISDYKDWDQRKHTDRWMLFEQNMNELYTVVTKNNTNHFLHPLLSWVEIYGRQYLHR